MSEKVYLLGSFIATRQPNESEDGNDVMEFVAARDLEQGYVPEQKIFVIGIMIKELQDIQQKMQEELDGKS